MPKVARDVMTPNVDCIGENETLLDAARMMAERGYGAMPICGEDNRLKGMLTDRDIVVKALAQGKDPASTRAGELGEGKPVTIGADDSLEETLQTMAKYKVRRLPVIDGHDLVGILAVADVARELGDDRERGDGLHRQDRGLELVEVVEGLDEEEVDATAFEQTGLLVEDGVRVLGARRTLQVTQRPDRAADQHGDARDLARLARQLHALLDDLLQPVVEELRRELAAVRAEGIRLDQLRPGPDEPRVDADHGLGRLEVRLLRAAQARDGRAEEGARADRKSVV